MIIESVISLAAVVGLFGITVAVFDHEAGELLAVANGLRTVRRVA